MSLITRMRRRAKYDTPEDPYKLLLEGADALESAEARATALAKALREIETRDSHTRFDGYGRPSKVPGPYAFIARAVGKDNG